MTYVYSALNARWALVAAGRHHRARAHYVKGYGWLVVSPARIRTCGLTLCEVEA